VLAESHHIHCLLSSRARSSLSFSFLANLLLLHHIKLIASSQSLIESFHFSDVKLIFFIASITVLKNHFSQELSSILLHVSIFFFEYIFFKFSKSSFVIN